MYCYFIFHIILYFVLIFIFVFFFLILILVSRLLFTIIFCIFFFSFKFSLSRFLFFFLSIRCSFCSFIYFSTIFMCGYWYQFKSIYRLSLILTKSHVRKIVHFFFKIVCGCGLFHSSFSWLFYCSISLTHLLLLLLWVLKSSACRFFFIPFYPSIVADFHSLSKCIVFQYFFIFFTTKKRKRKKLIIKKSSCLNMYIL